MSEMTQTIENEKEENDQTIDKLSEEDVHALCDALEKKAPEILSIGRHDNVIGLLSTGKQKVSFPVHLATLQKGESLYRPEISLVSTSSLNADQIKQLEKRIKEWLEKHITQTLDPILKLQDVGVKPAAKSIAFRLYEEYGILFRPRIKDMIAQLELEDRQALSRLGVRMGAHYIYVKDALKPALVRLTATLWRCYNAADPGKAVTPPDGNVSMSAPTDAPKRFYLAIGYPIFGDLAVRVDMIERLNSAIYENAVNGEYVFDPALSSTIGASNEQTQKVLDDLGFLSRTEKRPKKQVLETEEKKSDSKKTETETAPKHEDASPTQEQDAKNKENPEEVTEENVTIYLLKKRKPQKKAPLPKEKNKGASERKKSSKKAKGPKNKRKDTNQKTSSGHNAFAGLDKLLSGSEEK